MKTITIEINGKQTEITLTRQQLEQIQKSNPMEKVYKYHNTTEADFEKTYKNIPLHLKYLQKEVMIVAYKNQGWKPNINNSNQRKYYPWFYTSPFCFGDSYCHGSNSDVASCFLLQDEQKCKEMVEEFIFELEQSRCSHGL
jgi:hypothetical protein